MDPNATLKQLRHAIEVGEPVDTYELFEALDDWLTNGGFLPEAWDTRCFCQERER